MLTPAGSSVLVFEGLQYTGFRSGSPLTMKVYCGTAGTLLAAGQGRCQGKAHPSERRPHCRVLRTHRSTLCWQGTQYDTRPCARGTVLHTQCSLIK